jgi:hypothetical protein
MCSDALALVCDITIFSWCGMHLHRITVYRWQ